MAKIDNLKYKLGHFLQEEVRLEVASSPEERLSCVIGCYCLSKSTSTICELVGDVCRTDEN